MIRFLFALFIISLTIMSCTSAKSNKNIQPDQGISGTVLEARGNRMPMKGVEPQPLKGIRSTILIYDSTHLSQTTRSATSGFYTLINTRLVASVETDSAGKFIASLPPGKYSLFIKQGESFFANLFDQYNNIALFEVVPGRFTDAKLTLNIGATY